MIEGDEMARIPQQVIDEIREKTDIVNIIGQYVQLKKAGKNYTGLCPFHEERTPSFSVASDRQFYHCFGCGRGGNVFNFIQELEGLSFQEAVVRVAEMEGIPLSSQYMTASKQVGHHKNDYLYQMNQQACEVYQHILKNTQIGQAARNYLEIRQLDRELLEEFQIGFAPDRRDFLVKVFEQRGYTKEQMAASGLFVQLENGNFMDRFYSRVMFPIQDEHGRIIAFSGRYLPTDDEANDKRQPKYLNSPEGEIFNKREVLFNLHRAKATMRKDQEVYLFEGFMDVIAAYKSGIPNGLASMGTSLTEQQVRRIDKLVHQVVLCYDGDQAGQHAIYRAVSLFEEQSQLKMSIVSLPERLDPDEYVKKYGSESFVQLAQHSRQSVFQFMMQYKRVGRNLENDQEQIAYLNELLIELKKVDSVIEQDRYLNQLAIEFNVSRDALQQQLSQIQLPSPVATVQYDLPVEPDVSVQQVPKISVRVVVKKTQLQKAQELLLHRLFNDPSLNKRLKADEVFFIDEIYQEIYVLFDSIIEGQDSFTIQQFLDVLQENHLRGKVVEIASMNVPKEMSDQEWQDVIALINKHRIQELLITKKNEQQLARQQHQTDLELKLAVEIIQLTKQLKQMSQ